MESFDTAGAKQHLLESRDRFALRHAQHHRFYRLMRVIWVGIVLIGVASAVCSPLFTALAYGRTDVEWLKAASLVSVSLASFSTLSLGAFGIEKTVLCHQLMRRGYQDLSDMAAAKSLIAMDRNEFEECTRVIREAEAKLNDQFTKGLDDIFALRADALKGRAGKQTGT